jgi:hypothetical protein
MGFETCTNYPYTFCHITTDLLNNIVFYKYVYYLYNMILMSEKMTSQTITDEFICVSV